jgi:hypothetical protein
VSDPIVPPVPAPQGEPTKFELEPEAAAPRPVVLAPEDTEATKAALAAPPTLEKVVGKDGKAHVVSTRTLRERKDPTSRAKPGPVPLPVGWPREAFAYPLRDRLGFAAGVGVWVAIDVLGALSAALGWLAWVVVVPLIARWQTRAVARSATGVDVVPSLGDVGIEAADVPVAGGVKTGLVTFEDLRAMGLFLLYLAPAAVPFLVPYLRDPAHPVRTPGETAWLVAFLVIPLLVIAPAFLLASAFDDRNLQKPWVAARWFLRGPLAFAAVAVSWVLVLVGDGLVAGAWPGIAATFGASVLARGATVYALLYAARLLGVLGRRYEP